MSDEIDGRGMSTLGERDSHASNRGRRQKLRIHTSDSSRNDKITHKVKEIIIKFRGSKEENDIGHKRFQNARPIKRE